MVTIVQRVHDAGYWYFGAAADSSQTCAEMQVSFVLEDYRVVKTAKGRQFIWTQKGDAITIFGIDRSFKKNIPHSRSRAVQEEAIISAESKQRGENVPAVNRGSGEMKARIARLNCFYILRNVSKIDRFHFCLTKRPVLLESGRKNLVKASMNQVLDMIRAE